jgi:hypothetical protein
MVAPPGLGAAVAFILFTRIDATTRIGPERRET